MLTVVSRISVHPTPRKLECNGSAISNCFYLAENKQFNW
jgi:hypothetical protein